MKGKVSVNQREVQQMYPARCHSCGGMLDASNVRWFSGERPFCILMIVPRITVGMCLFDREIMPRQDA